MKESWMNLRVAHTLRFFMHLFNVRTLLLHLEVIYECGMDLEEKHCAVMSTCVCVCVCDSLSNQERIKMKGFRPPKKIKYSFFFTFICSKTRQHTLICQRISEADYSDHYVLSKASEASSKRNP